MATIILTALGTALGGPLGGMIGAALGQQVDRAVLGPKSTREGPRLKELDVQTSSYGTQIPAIFGAMRLAGTVIWATDLVEHRSKSGGGKGRPKTVEYSYSANMAVALSSRPVSHVGRIWAEGNILRGAAGDFKVETGFRFYNGHGDQMPDPLIASAEGLPNCPAYRGIAYAVFEGLQLADFGNRIPSLTFEIFERDGSVRLVDIAAAASEGLIFGDSREAVAGYALSGSSIRTAISPLLDTAPCLVRAESERLRLIDWLTDGEARPAVELVRAGRTGFDRAGQHLRPAQSVPGAVVIRHYDPARDYGPGSQRAQRRCHGTGEKPIDLPASVESAAALRMADLQLLQAQRARFSLDGHFLCAEDVRPGDWIVAASDPQPWRVIEIERLRGACKLKATRFLSGDVGLAGASPGRPVPSPDLEMGETRLCVIDLPALDESDPTTPIVGIFAGGTAPGWRRAALSIQRGDAETDIGSTAEPAKIGTAINALADHSPWLPDNSSALLVQMLHAGMELPVGRGSALHSDAPAFWLAGEYIRYGHADCLGPGRYRITGMVRGCFGSEAAISGHAVGDGFVLLETDTAKTIDPALLAIGEGLMVHALGVGDIAPASATVDIVGNALQPLPPVHLKAQMSADGGLHIGWIRRTRADGGWRDRVDVPLGEESESYALQIIADGILLGEWILAVNHFYLSPAAVESYGLHDSQSVAIAVRQQGRHAASSAATLITRFSQK